MDVIYIEQMIDTLETKRNEHVRESHSKHGAGCMQRFSRMIDGLKEKLSFLKATSEPTVTGRGDELNRAGKLNAKAEILEKKSAHLAAQETKKQARQIVANELNEMDGFPR